jgi:dephospho-CoA kinase
MMLVIGLVGRIASGKSIVADYLVREKKSSYYRFSDVLRDLLLRLHKPNTRENLQDLGIALRRMFGDGILAETLKADIESDEAEIVVVDGIRYEDEFRMIKGLGGIVMYVSAPQKARYERVISRGTRGEANITFDEFVKNEDKETERMIHIIGEKADYKIENSGTLDELTGKIDDILKKSLPHD